MLKIVFFSLLIISRVGRWFGFQIRIFIGAFLLSFLGLSEFFLTGAGAIFSVDFIGYILILLRF